MSERRPQTIAEKIERELAIAMANRITRGVSTSVRQESFFYLPYDAKTDTFGELRVWPVSLGESFLEHAWAATPPNFRRGRG